MNRSQFDVRITDVGYISQRPVKANHSPFPTEGKESLGNTVAPHDSASAWMDAAEVRADGQDLTQPLVFWVRTPAAGDPVYSAPIVVDRPLAER